jgi:hypothetical protein
MGKNIFSFNLKYNLNLFHINRDEVDTQAVKIKSNNGLVLLSSDIDTGSGAISTISNLLMIILLTFFVFKF